MTDKTVLLTSGSSWQVPEDFSGANSVECIGGGGGGDGTNGGDGGDYAKGVNLALNPGDVVALQVGAGGGDGEAGGDTVFGDIVAAGGGSETESAGDVVHAGGAGDTGGGGAGGPTGVGGDADGDTGGTGDGGVTASGADGTEWGTAGSGGGGSAESETPSAATRVAQQMNVGTSDVSSTSFAAVDVKAGDLLVVKYGCPFSNRYVNSVTQSAGINTWADALNSDPDTHSAVQQIRYAIASADASALVITPHFNGSIDTFGCSLEIYRPPAGKTWTFQSATSQLASDPGQNPDDISTPPITQPGNGVIAVWCGNTRDGFTCDNYDQSPGAPLAKADSNGSTIGFTGDYIFTGGLSAQVVSAGIGGNINGGNENWTVKKLLAAVFTYA